jgi:hypothetical protein
MQLNNHIVGRESLLLPAVFEVDYVTVREFFLSPEITCPAVVCSTETATLDVDPEASNITWTLSPGYLFSGATSGTGKTVTITPSGNYNDTGNIKFYFSMPSGETFSAEQTFGVKGPHPNDVHMHVWSDFEDPVTEMCANAAYYFYIYTTSGHYSCSCSNYSWSFPDGWDIDYEGGGFALIFTNDSPGGLVEVRATSSCCNETVRLYSGVWPEDVGCDYGGFFLMFTPNPATGETTLSIESTSEEKTFGETDRWDMEAYSETLLLKTRQSGLRGRNARIQTAGWQEGIYIVRVIYNDEILTGKLVVKR